ncbi:MAG: RNA polymerase sigma factor [Chitinophagaceae bacterium]|nr:RNA polymerase sigma factor [Chitinophagaceae bacterium]
MSLSVDIWEKIAQGDKGAYEELYFFLFRKFFDYGKKITDDEALIEDAAQEALITLWRKRNELHTIQYPKTYFYTTFRYSLYDRLRKQNKLVAIKSEDDRQDNTTEESFFRKDHEKHLSNSLQAAFESLTERQREAIHLRFYEELPYEEVASIMGITQKATYKIVARALLQLKGLLRIFLIGLSHIQLLK